MDNKYKFTKFTVTGYVKQMSSANKKEDVMFYGDEINEYHANNLIVKFPPRKFKIYESKNENDLLCKDENVSANLIGTCVDYMARLLFLKSPDAFDLAKKGAILVDDLAGYEHRIKSIQKSLKMSNGRPSNKALTNAIQLCVYDSAYRSGLYPTPVGKVIPDNVTCDHIRYMLQNVQNLFKTIGIPTVSEFQVHSKHNTIYGDGDFLNSLYLMDFKTISGHITSNMTLQLLSYYILGLQENKYKEFQTIKQLVIYNPRKDILYVCDIKDIHDIVMTMQKRINYDDECYYIDNLSENKKVYNQLMENAIDFIYPEVEIEKNMNGKYSYQIDSSKNIDNFLLSFDDYKEDLQVLKKLINARINKLNE